MSLDPTALAAAIAAHGALVRVVVAQARGSAPREAGASMLVWAEGQSGTIGGGTLEYDAALEARTMLAAGQTRRLAQISLGPDLGQCCGGAVTLLFELWDAEALADLGPVLYARPVETSAQQTPPLAIERLRATSRSAGTRPQAALIDGWFVEPIEADKAPIWIWGAGHVGRALVSILAPLPDLALKWVDTARSRFPQDLPANVTLKAAPDIAAAVADAPIEAHHLVLTYSHALDLALCDALLAHGFASAGLIGSATKWARFRTKLRQFGHDAAQLERITCPIGTKALGKHPQTIAVGVAHRLLMDLAKKEARTRPSPGDWEVGDDERALDA